MPLLDRQVEQGLELAATMPPALSGLVMPDSYLPWHLSAILAALCCDGKGEAVERSIQQATRFAIVVAVWVVRQHIHYFRYAFPADGDGSFTGQDLSVFRFLTAEPASVRDFQRCLRNVSKDSCLRSLKRAVTAGLAVETDRGRFMAVPQPQPGSELSDFLSEFDPRRIFPLGELYLSTDGTDKAPLPLSGITPQTPEAPVLGAGPAFGGSSVGSSSQQIVTAGVIPVAGVDGGAVYFSRRQHNPAASVTLPDPLAVAELPLQSGPGGGASSGWPGWRIPSLASRRFPCWP